MQIFKYPQDRLPIAFFVLLFLIDCAVFWFGTNTLYVVIWMLLSLGPKICICAWNHHHQHVHTFKQNFLNRALEFVYTFQTGITTNVWVLHHNLGHHLNYLDQTKDESAWMRKDGTKMGLIEYTLTIAITGYYRALKVGQKHPKFKPALFGVGSLALLILLALFYHNWLNALILFGLPMLIGYLLTCGSTYYHHAGLETDDHHEASYNILNKSYNFCMGNLGYHTAHHAKQGIHWSRLPEYHKQIEDKIPAHLYVKPCIPFRWFP